MPYINFDRREELRTCTIEDLPELTPGELTYLLYYLCLNFLPVLYRYSDLATVLGCLESCKQEFYRRVVAPYENIKKEENGDIEI